MNPRAERVAHLLKLHQSIGLVGKPRKRFRKLIYPVAIIREYAGELLQLVREVEKAYEVLVVELPQLLTTANSERSRQDAGESRRIKDLIDQAQEKLRGKLTTQQLEELAKKAAQRTSQYNKQQLSGQLKGALSVDVFMSDKKIPQLVENFVAANVALIKDIPVKLSGEIERATTRALQTGMRYEALAEELVEKFDMAENRARLIARDQIGSLNGQLNAARQQDLGVEKFIWRTVNDERVRPEHEEREGETFRYDDPPEDGIPGEPINCRCSAEPVLDFLNDEL